MNVHHILSLSIFILKWVNKRRGNSDIPTIKTFLTQFFLTLLMYCNRFKAFQHKHFKIMVMAFVTKSKSIIFRYKVSSTVYDDSQAVHRHDSCLIIDCNRQQFHILQRPQVDSSHQLSRLENLSQSLFLSPSKCRADISPVPSYH